MNPGPGRPSVRRFSLRTAMLAIAMIALGLMVVIQARMRIEQDRKIARLEATNERIERQNLQLANWIIRDQQGRRQDLSDLRREVEAVRRSLEKPPSTEPIADDATTPQGEWLGVTSEFDGALGNSGEGASKVLTIVEGDSMRTEKDGKVVTRWTITFDPSKSPAEFDARIETGKFAGKYHKGIYRIEGDLWTSCYGPHDTDRPTKFESPVGSNLFLNVRKRKMPPQAGQAPAATRPEDPSKKDAGPSR